MHYCVLYYLILGLLPVLVVSAVSPFRRSFYGDALPLDVANSIQSLSRDENSAQASFFVPCFDCIGGIAERLNQSFLFNFEAFPSNQPCGVNNISLNGIPIVQDWEATGFHAQGAATLNSSGHALNAFVTSDCLQGAEGENKDSDTRSQVLTFTFQKVDQESVKSLTGFTLSFKQHPQPELLRLSLQPEYSARDLPDSETWRDPPPSLRLAVPTSATASPVTETSLSLHEQLEELQQLEAQANELVALITQKKEFINSHFLGSAHSLKEEIKDCDSFLCIVKAIGNRVHNAAHAAFLRFHDSHQAYAHWSAAAGGQAPTMISTDGVAVPEQCHTNTTRTHVVEKPPPYRPTSTVTDEKSPTTTASAPHNTEEPKWRDARDPSILFLVLRYIAVITGLAFIFTLLRRCCTSDRKRADRAAEQERRATERLYKCAARRQSWRDWWSGRKRGKPGYRNGDYEEKRALILRQEHILEGAMQDEIQQLRIQEEIRQLRRTRDALDDLVRAEEGRSTVPPRYSSSSYNRYSAGRPVPAPITIPSATSRMYPSQHNNSPDDGHPPTPLSRTSSLPGYKTDGSEPPGYESDRRSSFSSHDGDGAFSEYAHSIRTTTSQWSPDSSIPDLSPRPSMETAMTVETARTFL